MFELLRSVLKNLAMRVRVKGEIPPSTPVFAFVNNLRAHPSLHFEEGDASPIVVTSPKRKRPIDTEEEAEKLCYICATHKIDAVYIPCAP